MAAELSDSGQANAFTPRLVKAHWQRTILVCSKCSKRLGGGFGKKGKRDLAKAMRDHLGIKRWRKAPIGIVEVKCLGICPRGGVTVVDAAQPGQWRVIPKGAAVAEVAAALNLEPLGQSR